jgi:dipeptidyl aminopeptidase/acylaminoacyl peptidase
MSPYGSWPSPITADLIVEASVSIGELWVGTDDVWWSELRPQEGGRVAIVRHRPGGERLDVLPTDLSARTRVHEYGGGAWWLHDDALFIANWTDQRLHRIDADSVPRVLTPKPPTPAGARYADGRVTPDGRWIVCVRELHGSAEADEPANAEPVNEIVAVHAHDGGGPVVLATGADFVSSPRVSPDGRHLCWTQWDHPRMPWDGTELWVGDLHDDAQGISVSNPRRVAGGTTESVVQPSWSRSGDLLFVSDRTGWWNLYRIGAEGSEGAETPCALIEGEIGAPQWVFGQSRYAELNDGRILCAVAQSGFDHLGVVEPGDTTVHPLTSPFTSLASLRSFGDGAVLVGASATDEPSVVLVDLAPGARSPTFATLRAPRDLGVDRSFLSVPESLTFPTGAADEAAHAHALYYPPTNPGHEGPPDERPPLVVVSHGGPTSAARPQLNLAIQYWTSRGLAVVDVNYRGSTGYGREYRDALDDLWGIADVEDCIAAARFLVERGDVDGSRLAIRGGSAGGYTTLCALTFHDAFSAGASLYGVADLEALARDTHKFEARYLDDLIGPYPETRDRYVARSPIHHVDDIDCPVILFQGLEDEIVPPSQAETMVDALRRKRLPVAYLTFEQEQHGFRQAPNIKRVVEAELYFYSRVFQFELADDVEPVRIDNL